jgi:hypothetical protein
LLILSVVFPALATLFAFTSLGIFILVAFTILKFFDTCSAMRRARCGN